MCLGGGGAKATPVAPLPQPKTTPPTVASLERSGQPGAANDLRKRLKSTTKGSEETFLTEGNKLV